MANEVIIRVTSRNDTAKGFSDAKRDVEQFADDSAAIYQKRFAMRMNDLGRNLATPLANSGKQMGERLANSSAGEITRTIGQRIKQDLPKAVGDGIGQGFDRTVVNKITEKFVTDVNGRLHDSRGRFVSAGRQMGVDLGDGISQTLHSKITDKIKTSVELDADTSLRSKSEKLGEKIGDSIGNGLGGTLQAFFSGDLISLLVKALAAGALASALAPVLGAAITSAILMGVGGAAIGAGISAAFKDPQIKAAAAELKKNMGDIQTEFGKPFRSPVAETLEKLNRYVQSLGPRMRELGEVMAPVVGQLGTGLVSLLQNAMPGILKAVEASKPLFETLAKHMPAIGTAIGKFFDKISEQGDDAALFFGDMLSLLEKVIPLIGSLIATLASAYSKTHNMVKGAIGAFNDFKAAIGGALRFAEGVFWGFMHVATDVFGRILTAAVLSLGWIPGLGPKLAKAQEKFTDFRRKVDRELAKIANKNINIKVRFSILGLAAANAAIQTGIILRSMGYAAGGIVGAAASGGVRSGLNWVGERGPELVKLPTGSTVYSAGDSKRMAAQGDGGGGALTLDFAPGAGDKLMDAIVDRLRYRVGRLGGGNVQSYLGAGAT